MKKIALVASGDFRESANITCWPAQKAMEDKLTAIFAEQGYELWRAHPVKPSGHGFISGQREGMDVFSNIDSDMPIVVAEAVWQYSYHVLPGLISHKGPILIIANWSGRWPGLVGALNLHGSLTKAGVSYSSLWSEDFTDKFFKSGLMDWLSSGQISHDVSHVKPYLSGGDTALAQRIADDMRKRKRIMGVFDEGCMGMYNAIIPDELLMPLGVFKERLSQSALYHSARNVPLDEAQAAYEWMRSRGMTFHFGQDPATELTEEQVIDQCRLYIAATRLADEFGCDIIGVQYQQGLKDLWPASDLAEGMMNNADRPPVKRQDGSIIRDGQPVLHFNEVDECAALDALLINQIHAALDLPIETTLHDIRWGDVDRSTGGDEFIWVFEISGAVPPAHHLGGWAGSESLRQPPMYFPSGGGSLKGYAKEGNIIWSRIFIADGRLNMDLGLGQAVALSPEECERRSKATTFEWPIMNAVLDGVTRDQLMAHHKANHVQVVYATSQESARQSMLTRAALAKELGMTVNLCGV